MVSELFFYFLYQKVRVDFERILLTHTVTHTPIADSGQSSIFQNTLPTKSKNF